MQAFTSLPEETQKYLNDKYGRIILPLRQFEKGSRYCGGGSCGCKYLVDELSGATGPPCRQEYVRDLVARRDTLQPDPDNLGKMILKSAWIPGEPKSILVINGRFAAVMY